MVDRLAGRPTPLFYVERMNKFILRCPTDFLIERAKTTFQKGCEGIPVICQIKACEVLVFTLRAWTQDNRLWAADSQVLRQGVRSSLNRINHLSRWLMLGLLRHERIPNNEVAYRGLFLALAALMLRPAGVNQDELVKNIHKSVLTAFRESSFNCGIPSKKMSLSVWLLMHVYGLEVSLARACSVPLNCEWPLVSEDEAHHHHEIAAFEVAAQISCQIYTELRLTNNFICIQ
ncbi:hypothetical protein DSO57_1005521 [Entomophthora muscae]|uniref:Uncharacterized protein n=1 Tax=Entomophthora muscae TaxID=34485 RepID=A0ACC2SWY4_9FUNG|nr:hypothetical protein DSO57_1005521 [Entomophthora muscae]